MHFTDNEWAWQRCLLQPSGLHYPQCTAHRWQKSCFLGSLIELWPCQPVYFLLFDGIMYLSGAGLGEMGPGQGPGAGPTPGSCNPRKFSEKIALHNLRQAEDTAAFREVMMDVTSIRVSLTQFKTRRAHLRQLSYIWPGLFRYVCSGRKCLNFQMLFAWLVSVLLIPDNFRYRKVRFHKQKNYYKHLNSYVWERLSWYVNRVFPS